MSDPTDDLSPGGYETAGRAAALVRHVMAEDWEAADQVLAWAGETDAYGRLFTHLVALVMHYGVRALGSDEALDTSLAVTAISMALRASET